MNTAKQLAFDLTPPEPRTQVSLIMPTSLAAPALPEPEQFVYVGDQRWPLHPVNDYPLSTMAFRRIECFTYPTPEEVAAILALPVPTAGP